MNFRSIAEQNQKHESANLRHRPLAHEIPCNQAMKTCYQALFEDIRLFPDNEEAINC